MAVKKVSIIVPTYNRPKETEAAIKSLLKLDYPDFEIIVVDDASTDNTASVLARFGKKIRVIRRKKNGGPAAARNDGLRAAKGEFIAFTDSDCTVSKNWIKTLVKFIETKTENVAGVCGTIYPPKDANELMRLIYFMPQMDGNTLLADKLKKPFSVSNISCNNALWRKNVIKKMNGFDESFFRAYRVVPEDSELCYRTLKDGHVFYMYPGAEVYHHFRPTFTEFLKQSYRAGRGGGVVMFKQNQWFGPSTLLLIYAFPLFLMFALTNPVLLLAPLVFSADTAAKAYNSTKDAGFAAKAALLWLVKTYANMLGVWKGIIDVVKK